MADPGVFAGADPSPVLNPGVNTVRAGMGPLAAGEDPHGHRPAVIGAAFADLPGRADRDLPRAAGTRPIAARSRAPSSHPTE